jgi:hypothetical protein
MRLTDLSPVQLRWIRIACVAYGRGLIPLRVSEQVVRFVLHQPDELPAIPENYVIG